MATPKFTSVPSKRLAASITASSSTIQLNNILGWNGAALTSSDFGTNLYAVLRNDANTLMELIELDPSTIASASITVLRRGLKFTGDVTTEVTANKLIWVKNETIVEIGADTPQLFQMFKEYVDAAIVAGGVPATTATAGISKVATQAQTDAGTTGDGTYKYIVTPDLVRAKAYHDYAADAGSTDAYAITVTPAITAYATGQIFTFKANTINTGAATLNVNSLGAKTIKKNGNTDLATGDIAASQIIVVVYDGTNMQLQSGIGVNITNPTVQTFTASGTYTKPSGLKYAVVEAQGGGGSGGNTAAGADGGGGGGGAYVKKIIAAASIGATETVTIGAAATATTFGALLTGAAGATASASSAGAGGTASGGDVNINGQAGQSGNAGTSVKYLSAGGSSRLGSGGKNGQAGAGYGFGGCGDIDGTGLQTGGSGVVIVTEYY